MVPHLLFNQRQRVRRSRDGARRLAGFANLRGLRAANKDLSGAAADKAVARQGFAAFDGFQEIGRAGVLELGVRRDRGFEIRHQVRIDGNHVPLGGEAYKGVPGRVDVHRQRLGLMRAQIAGRKAEPVPGRGSGQRRRRGRVVPLDAAPSGILCPRRVGSDRRSLRTDPMETAGLTGQSRSHLIRITRGESAPAGRLGL